MPEMPPGGVDVFGLTRQAASELLALNESSSSLVGQLFWIGFRRLEIPYRRQARQEGVSGWTLAKKVRYLSDSVYSFTSLPISFVTWLGAIGLVVTLLLSAFTFVAWLLGWVTEPGYTTLMLVLLASTFLVVLSLGIVGNYVWRTYENSKGRPIAVVMESPDTNDRA
jgi:CBS domain containing-hemolysin-like protein